MKVNMSIMKKLMKRNSIRICLIVTMCITSSALKAADRITVTSKDITTFNRVMILKQSHSANTCADIGLFFQGTPYVAKTLDQTTDEHLVVNLHQFDCTTFVESVLALWLIPDNATFDDFCKMLQTIRYRNGAMNGYCSRLHYFSDWIIDNQQKGYIKDITQQLGGEEFICQRNFMSTHSELYLQLKNDSSNLAEIAQHEKRVNANSFYYIPTNKIGIIENVIPSGSIIAITTKIRGLDISHVGFAVKQNGKTYFLHAPSAGKQVTLTTLNLSEYIASKPNNTGIVVLVPVKKLP